MSCVTKCFIKFFHFYIYTFRCCGFQLIVDLLQPEVVAIAKAVKNVQEIPAAKEAPKQKQVMRRPYATAEEKIQQELQDMKQSEKELR